MKCALFLFAVMLSGCAQERREPVKVVENPHSYGSPGLALPKRIKISWPPPVNHSEPDAVVFPRLKQMEATVRLSLGKKGYAVFGNLEFPEQPYASASIDYDTSPAWDGRGWTQKAEVSFLQSSNQKVQRLGGCFATWNNYPTPAIDTALMSLTLQAVEHVPKFSAP